LINFRDAPGYFPRAKRIQWYVLSGHGAKILYAGSEATGSTFTLLLCKEYGVTVTAVCFVGIVVDPMFVRPTAERVILDMTTTVDFIYRNKLIRRKSK
jgi:acetyl-CoA carboxylase carboxyltransferase component